MINTKFTADDDECVARVIDDMLEYAKGAPCTDFTHFNEQVVDKINTVWEHGNIKTNLALRNLYSFLKDQRQFYTQYPLSPEVLDIVYKNQALV